MWQQTADGETVHETGCSLVDLGYRDGDRIVRLLSPNGDAVCELRRDGRGRWRHPGLPSSHDGSFATAEAAANDLLDRVLQRGVHAGTGETPIRVTCRGCGRSLADCERDGIGWVAPEVCAACELAVAS